MDTYVLKYDKTIKKWDDGIPLGNGDIGCLIWNKPGKLRLSVDKGGIWDCSSSPEAQEDFTYANVKELVERRDSKTLARKYDDCYSRPIPTKLPAGKIIIDLKTRANVTSELNFYNGVARLRAGGVLLTSYVHANMPIGCIKVNSENIEIFTDNPKYGSEKHKNKKSGKTVQSLKNLCYKAAVFSKESITVDKGVIELNYFVQEINGGSYGIMYGALRGNGETLIYYSVGVGKDVSWVKRTREHILDAFAEGYDGLLSSHTKWWNDYNNISDIILPDKAVEKQWRLNNYLLAACSRKNYYPMPLQGVWTADNGKLPPWKGDYHHDLNTQMSYTSYLKANRLQEGECFFDYLFSLTDRAKEFARKFYNAKGLCLPSVMDIEGHALGGWAMYSLSPTNQLWLADMMTRYYNYTRNTHYLNEMIYPYCSLIGEFIMDLLVEKDGFYKLPLSSSPEIHDNKLEAFLLPNSNYDEALLIAFFRDMITICGALGKTDEVKTWQSRMTKLEPPAVTDDGVLMLNSVERLTVSHRHHSHAMAIYPLRLLDYDVDKDRRIIDATVRDLERLGRSEWVGYSFGWMAQFYAVQRNGDKAIGMLKDFWEYCCLNNGFHVNGDYKKKLEIKTKYRLFTLEGNFIAVDALQEMLLHSENGIVELFRAVPSTWQDAEFKRLRANGAILVSALMQGGKIIRIELTAEAPCDFVLTSRCPLPPSAATGMKVSLKSGETLILE